VRYLHLQRCRYFY